MSIRHDLATLLRALAYTQRHDPATMAHGLRTSLLAARLSRRMRLPFGEARTIAFAAAIHDVGKIDVPLALLTKRGALSREEWHVMREHSAAGETFLTRIARDWTHAPLVRAHHERYDGQGYPDGLRRDQIPLGARVLSVVDVWDALTQMRSYKPPIAHAGARDLMIGMAGRYFEPDILDLWLEIVR